MTFYRRRLPHLYETGQPVFLTWRLHDSLPSHRVFPAKRANAILTLTGSLFWQEARLRVLGKSYDHLVRHEGEFEKIQNYIEENPVRAGLVREASEYRWSSAGWATGGSPADQGVRPTTLASRPSLWPLC